MRKDKRPSICPQALEFPQSMRENKAALGGTADKVVSVKLNRNVMGTVEPGMEDVEQFTGDQPWVPRAVRESPGGQGEAGRREHQIRVCPEE